MVNMDELKEQLEELEDKVKHKREEEALKKRIRELKNELSPTKKFRDGIGRVVDKIALRTNKPVKRASREEPSNGLGFSSPLLEKSSNKERTLSPILDDLMEKK